MVSHRAGGGANGGGVRTRPPYLSFSLRIGVLQWVQWLQWLRGLRACDKSGIMGRATDRHVGHVQMKFGMSMFVDAFLGSGVPLGGDPITLFQNVPVLGLRTATVLNNRYPMVQDVVKVRFIATNCGAVPLEIVPASKDDRELSREHTEDSFITLLPGESIDYSIFRSWDAPGEHQLTLAYKARCAGLPFARLTYPAVAIHVRPPQADKLMHWIGWARAAHPQVQ